MKETLFEKASFLYFFKEKKGQMVKAKAPRIVASRTLDSMRRANAKANVRLGEKVRSKCAPRKLAASKKRCAQVKAARKKFSPEMKFIVAAREYAQDCYRRTLRELKGAKPRAQKEKGKAPGARPRHRTSAARAALALLMIILCGPRWSGWGPCWVCVGVAHGPGCRSETAMGRVSDACVCGFVLIVF